MSVSGLAEVSSSPEAVPLRVAGARDPQSKVTPQWLQAQKRAGRPFSALTAYDYPSARLVDEAGVDVVLVGDSLAMTVLGHPDTLSITMDEMLHHTRAARRGVERALLIADMPYGSYHGSADQAVANALRFVKEAGAEAVKLEGGAARTGLVTALTAAEIPVVAHIGLTPQSLLRMGGYRVQGRDAEAAGVLLADAHALAAAGAVLLVLEGMPRELAAEITSAVEVPTLGIGAGPTCDGQILVFHDLFGLSFRTPAKFVRGFGAGVAVEMRAAIAGFREAVEQRSFPADGESYHMSPRAAESTTARRAG